MKKGAFIATTNLPVLQLLVTKIRIFNTWFFDPALAEIVTRAISHKQFPEQAGQQDYKEIVLLAENIPNDTNTILLVENEGKITLKSIILEEFISSEEVVECKFLYAETEEELSDAIGKLISS